jgi:ubiquinone/menaquinone biosynthesis C-methylase UbiE
MNARLLDSISTADEIALHPAKNVEYERLVKEEIEEYGKHEVTDDLLLGGVHAFKAWAYNFDYLYKNYFKTDVYKEVCRIACRRENPRLLSLGCGFGGHELHVARRLRPGYELIALDLNPSLYTEAQRRAAAEGMNVEFRPADLNFVDFPEASFDVIYAIASLHHMLNLEHLFGAIRRGLKPDGRLVIVDMIGKNQVLHWKENVEFAAKVIRRLPRRYRPRAGSFWKNWWFDPYLIINRYVEPTEQVGMEGIRQEDIEPLLNEWFVAEKVFRYNGFMRLIATNPYLGARLDPDREDDRRYLEKLIALDYKSVQSGRLRATELFGVFSPRSDR